ncbi:MAG: hypothetical protein QME81_17405 [bacterium]|nr:hypothetical protein [bacterium]
MLGCEQALEVKEEGSQQRGDAAIMMTLEEIIESLHNLEDRMQVFEKKYNLVSDDFYRLARAGRLEQNKDFIKWMGYYELWLNRKELYRRLFAERLPMTAKAPVDLRVLA